MVNDFLLPAMAHFLIHSPIPARAYEVLSFSWRGSGHRAKEEPKQDFCGHRDLGPFGVLAVVSDGVGSCPRSREGAESVVRTSLDTLQEAVYRGVISMEASELHWRAWIATSVERNRKCLADLLREPDPDYPEERKIRELFSATQLLVWTDGRQFVASVVGDGAIIGIRRSKEGGLEFEDLAEVRKNGLANEVIPVTLPNWERGWLFRGPEECRSFEGIMLMTDGFSDTAGDTFYPYLWESLSKAAPSDSVAQSLPEVTGHQGSPFEVTDKREAFLAALSKELESRRISADDKTLVAIRFL